MFCIKCGTEYQVEQIPFGKSKFCRNCGELLYKNENDIHNEPNKYNTTDYQTSADSAFYNNTYVPLYGKKSNTALYVYLGVMFAIILSILGWYYYDKHKNNEEMAVETVAEESTVMEVIADSTLANTHTDTTKPSTQVVTEEITPQNESEAYEYLDDGYFKNTIQLYYDTEKQRNFDNLYNSYLSNIEQYYDLTYPSYEQLSKRFNATWNVTTDVTNSIKSYEIIRYDNSVQVKIILDYTYYGLKIQQYKTVNDIHLIFNFDLQGKIKGIYN